MAALLSNRARKLKPPALPRLWFLTDSVRTPDVAAAVARLPRGSGVIFRHYEASDRSADAQALARLCRRYGLVFSVARDWTLAAQVHADGVHLPEACARSGLSAAGRLWRRNHKALLTVAAHGYVGVKQGRAQKATAALLSPVLATASHPDRPPLGLARAALIVRHARLPVIALGGMTPKLRTYVRQAGFAGLAGISFALG